MPDFLRRENRSLSVAANATSARAPLLLLARLKSLGKGRSQPRLQSPDAGDDREGEQESRERVVLKGG